MSHSSSRSYTIAIILNWLLLAILVASVFGFLSFENLYGLFLASVTAFIAVGVFKKKAWGYFAAGAWSLAAYQLAKEGYEFQNIKHQVMTLGFILIPVAIFLHEILAKKNPQSSSTSDNSSQKSAENTLEKKDS